MAVPTEYFLVLMPCMYFFLCRLSMEMLRNWTLSWVILVPWFCYAPRVVSSYTTLSHPFRCHTLNFRWYYVKWSCRIPWIFPCFIYYYVVVWIDRSRLGLKPSNCCWNLLLFVDVCWYLGYAFSKRNSGEISCKILCNFEINPSCFVNPYVGVTPVTSRLLS